MAISVTAQRRALSTTSTTSTAFSPTTAVGAGSLAVIAATTGANKTLSSVTDTDGHTWGVDVSAGDGTRSIHFASAQVSSEIGTGDTITLNWSNGTSTEVNVWVFELASAATSSAFDTFASGSGTGTALSAGPTATLAQADEAVFGCFRTSSGASTWTKGASYTDPTTPSQGTKSACEYKIVAATTAVTADGSMSGSGSWAASVATYKGVVVAGGDRPKTLTLTGVGQVLLLFRPKAGDGAPVVTVVGHFDQPTPAQTSDFDEPTPSAAHFDQPTPS